MENNPDTVELRFNEVQGDWGNWFVISRVRYIGIVFHTFTNTGLKNIVRYTKDFVIQRLIKSRLHCITNPRYNKPISPVPCYFVKSSFHCNFTSPRLKLNDHLIIITSAFFRLRKSNAVIKPTIYHFYGSLVVVVVCIFVIEKSIAKFSFLV